MQCIHCHGRLLMYREIGEEPYLKCLQCSRVAGDAPRLGTPEDVTRAEGNPVADLRRHRASRQWPLAG